MMVIDNKYEIGAIVYLVTDEEQRARIITFIKILPGGVLSYELSCGHTGSEHYDFEISAEKDLVNAI